MNRQMTSMMPVGAVEGGAEDAVSLNEIIGGLIHRRIVIALTTLIFGLLGYGFVASMVDRFSASSEIMLYPQKEQIISSEDIVSNLRPDEQLIATEIRIISARPMAEIVVDRLGLASDPQWNGMAPPPLTVQDRIRSLLSGPRTQELTSEDRRINAVAAVMAATKSEQIGESLVISIRATAFEPTRAAAIANALRDAYVSQQTSANEDVSARATEWFQQRLDTLQIELAEKERAVEQYRDDFGLLSTSGSTLTEQQIRDAQRTVADARADLVAEEAKLEQVIAARSSPDALDQIALSTRSDLINRLRARQAETSAELAELESRYGPRHPSVIELRAEKSDIALQIEREIARIVNNLENDVSVARSRLALATRDRAGFEERMADNNRSLVRLRELERDANATKDLYEGYVKRFQEVNDQASLGIAPIRLISAAVPPLRSNTPSMPLTVLASLLLGGILGTGLALLMNAMDDRLRTKPDVESRLGLPVVALLPLQRSSLAKRLFGGAEPPWRDLVTNRLSRFGESLRLLLKTIMREQDVGETPIVAITSALPDEGKTNTSICLARSAALSGKKALLIDCDLRKRSVTNLVANAVDGGLKNVLRGEMSLQDAVVSDVDTGAAILPCLFDEAMDGEMFASKAMRDLLREASEIYDIVILDCPPILAVADASTLSSISSQVIMVTRYNSTEARVANAAVDQIRSSGGKITGIVLNCVKSDRLGLFAHGDREVYRRIERAYYTT